MSTKPTKTAQRLKWLIKAVKGSQEDLAEAIDATQSAISLILVGKTRNSRLLPKIADYYGVNLSWLTGTSDDLIWMRDDAGNQISEDDLALISIGKSNITLATVEPDKDWNKITNTPRSTKEIDAAGIAMIPVFSLETAAEKGFEIQLSGAESIVPFAKSELAALTNSPQGSLFAARFDDNSMMPTILDGETCLIDYAQRKISKPDHIWAIESAGMVMIKRVRKMADGSVELRSDNPAISVTNMGEKDFRILGRVIWVGKRL